MDNKFYLNYIHILYKWIKHFHNWYFMSIKDINIFFESILKFIYQLSYYIEIQEHHYVCTLIYFKRFLLTQSEKNPFLIFILSFIYTCKYWEESNFCIRYIYIVLDKIQKNLFDMEYEILEFDIPLLIHTNTYQYYYRLIY